MRRSKLTASEIEAQELAADKEKSDRKNGLSMIPLRDRGGVEVAKDIYFLWNVPDENRLPGLAYANVPDNHFILETKGKRVLFDAEEFRGWLRWA